MFLKDRATVFVGRPSKTDPYDVVYDRFDLRNVMAFEKQSVGIDGRDEGRCLIYFFPRSSRLSGRNTAVTEDGFPVFRPGDYCVVGACRGSYNPKTDGGGLCRRIVSVEKRCCGSENACHVVLEAV